MYWRFKRYVSADGDQVRAWYDQQTEGVRAWVYGIIDAAARDDEAPHTEFTPCAGDYAELCQLEIFIPSPGGLMRHIGLIGFWQPDSTIFVALICDEINEYNQLPLLERARRYKHDFDNDRGEIHDLFDDEDAEEFLS